LADASPAADTAPPLLALEASVHTQRGIGKGREILLDEFFIGPNQTILEADEIITKITFPTPKDRAWGAHIKLGLRDAMAISVVSIAVMLEMDGRLCRRARVALGAVAPKPIRAHRVEGLLEGREIDGRVIDECAGVVKEEISPISDIRASAEYRTLATAVLLKRAIHEALA
jgi:carbon-monoxide dehydrogenase medium subunit